MGLFRASLKGDQAHQLPEYCAQRHEIAAIYSHKLSYHTPICRLRFDALAVELWLKELWVGLD